MFKKFGSWFIFLVSILFKSSNQSTITAYWEKIPTKCLNPWKTLPHGPKLSSAPITGFSLTEVEPYQSMVGVKCDDGTKTSCEWIMPINESNLCMNVFKTDNSQMMVKQETIASITKELYILHESTGNFLSVTEPRFSLNIPRLEGEHMSARFQNGIVACHSSNKGCQFWGEDSSNWTSFPSMNFDHNHGSLNSVGGKLVAIGGNDESFQSHTKMEIFNGKIWIPSADLAVPRSSFATAVINHTSLVLIGGYNNFEYVWTSIGADFLMYHVDTAQWVSLPDYPKKQINLVCCNLNSGSVQGILCIGGDGPDGRHALMFDWKTFMWSRMPQLDFLNDGNTLGSITQFKDSLYYSPFFNRESSNYVDKVYKIDLNASSSNWEDLGLNTSTPGPFPLFYQVEIYKID